MKSVDRIVLRIDSPRVDIGRWCRVHDLLDKDYLEDLVASVRLISGAVLYKRYGGVERNS